ncbi:hypothetical protein KSS87_022032 [Heliosperma pusillum]|nr:hypothetical protein KSS87_022032 [Heliosperma pusillum]
MGELASLRPTGYVDPGWDHGTAQDAKKKKVKCNYCGKVVSGGIYRLKQHLARVSGEVTYCDKAPEDVYTKMRENLESCRSNKKPKLSENDQREYINYQTLADDDDGVETMNNGGNIRKGKRVLNDKGLVEVLTPLRSLGYVDPGWEHGVAQDERKKKVKCNYCGKIVSGGINRFKQHLAKIPGEVAPCKNAPDEVYMKIKENMKWHRTGRKLRKPDDKDTPSFFTYSDNDPEDDEAEESSLYGRDKVVSKRSAKDFRMGFSGMSSGSSSEIYVKRSRLNPTFIKTPIHHMPLTYQQGSPGPNKKHRREVASAICEFFYYAGVPVQAASSLSFQKMLDLVGHYGPGVVSPSSRHISGRFLQDELSTVKSYLSEYRTCWAVTGCSIMADSWRNSHGRTVINFLASCPRGMYFVSSFDATDVLDDPLTLFKLLDGVVDEIGEENVVQVVTQNTHSYRAAGKMLEDKRKKLFWTPCTVYCINKVLEEFTKLKFVSECMEKAQKLTKFIYNRRWLLNLMKREFTGGQDLLRPAITRYAASFFCLQGVLDYKIELRRMFQSSKWLLCQCSKSDEGKEVEKIVLSTSFWKKLLYIWKVVEPILHILQKVDCYGNMAMPFIYHDMYKVKLAIKNLQGDDVHKYGPFLNVIESHWNSLFHHPLYLAAYCLNPAYRYRPDYQSNPEVARGLNECIVRLGPDSGRRVSASMQISDFISAKADFGTELAISTRTELDPAIWWQQHGVNCLELQQIALRILSQTCSSIGCEHNWSVHDQIHHQRQNGLAQKKFDELVYIHYNLRLRERQIRPSDELISFDSALLEGLLDDWIVEPENPTMQIDEDIFDPEDGYDCDILDYENGISDSRRGCLEMTLAEAEPLVHPNACPTTDDHALDFLDDGLSD